VNSFVRGIRTGLFGFTLLPQYWLALALSLGLMRLYVLVLSCCMPAYVAPYIGQLLEAFFTFFLLAVFIIYSFGRLSSRPFGYFKSIRSALTTHFFTVVQIFLIPIGLYYLLDTSNSIMEAATKNGDLHIIMMGTLYTLGSAVLMMIKDLMMPCMIDQKSSVLPAIRWLFSSIKKYFWYIAAAELTLFVIESVGSRLVIRLVYQILLPLPDHPAATQYPEQYQSLAASLYAVSFEAELLVSMILHAIVGVLVYKMVQAGESYDPEKKSIPRLFAEAVLVMFVVTCLVSILLPMITRFLPTSIIASL